MVQLWVEGTGAEGGEGGFPDGPHVWSCVLCRDCWGLGESLEASDPSSDVPSNSHLLSEGALRDSVFAELKGDGLKVGLGRGNDSRPCSKLGKEGVDMLGVGVHDFGLWEVDSGEKLGWSGIGEGSKVCEMCVVESLIDFFILLKVFESSAEVKKCVSLSVNRC